MDKRLLEEFTKYCEQNPTERFWQALRNWANTPYIFFGNDSFGKDLRDTFYFEDKNE